MELLQKHTFQKTAFHVTEQEIEEGTRRGWDSGCRPAAYPLMLGVDIWEQVVYPEPSCGFKAVTR